MTKKILLWTAEMEEGLRHLDIFDDTRQDSLQSIHFSYMKKEIKISLLLT